MIKKILPFGFILFYHFSFSQLKQGTLIINGIGTNSGIQTKDGGYMLGGTGGNNSNTYFYFVKLDTNGNLSWAKGVGGTLNSLNKSVIQTKDGGYASTGYCTSGGAGGEDVYVVKVDLNGNLQWTRTIGGPDDDYGESIIQTKDGGYAITGGTHSYGGGSPNYGDIWVIKLDSSGNKVWTKTIEGPWGSDDNGYSIIQTKDGGYAVTGSVLDVVGWPDVFVAKLDSAGNLIWSEAVGGANDYGDGYSIIQSKDGGFAIAGFTHTHGIGLFNVYIVKLDSVGNLKWAKTVGGTKNDNGFSITQSKDNGFIVAGVTTSFGADSDDVYIIKLDTAGNMKWTRVYGYGEYNLAYSIVQTKDKGFAVTGAYENGIYFLKLDSLGNSCTQADTGGIIGSGGTVTVGGFITSADSGIVGSGGALVNGVTETIICQVSGVPQINEEEEVSVFPNPSTGQFTLSLSNVSEKCNVEVYNVLGERVFTLTPTPTPNGEGNGRDGVIDLGAEPNGIYLYRVITENGGLVGEGKIVIQK